MIPLHAWVMENGEMLQFVLFFAGLTVLAVAERFVPRRTGNLDRKRRWRANFVLTAANFATLSVLPVGLIGAALWARGAGWGVMNTISLSFPLVFVLTMLIRAFVSFFTHLMMHKVPLLWRVHRVHHLDTELDVSTTVRFHPLEFVIGALIGGPIVVLFGLPPWMLVVYELFDVVVNLWSHSNVRIPRLLNRVIRYFIVTPDLHRIHHSSWQPETDSNYGAVFPVWDILFRTFKAEPRDGLDHMELGLKEVRGEKAQRPGWLLASVLERDPSDD